MGSRRTVLSGSWLPILLVVLVVGLLGGQVIATWDPPDNSYRAGFWDAGDEDALLVLVWDHASGTLPAIPLLVAVWATRSAAMPAAYSADSFLLFSFDSRAPPFA